jgi:hypothetical protein
LTNQGENPNELNLDEKGKVLAEFGRTLVRTGSRVPDELYRKLAGLFSAEQIVGLTVR